MNFSLSEDQSNLRREIIRFARRELNHDVEARDREGEFCRDLWVLCGSLGLLGLPVPEEYGGSAQDPLTTALALESLGYACEDGGLVFSICAHLLACVVPVWKHGSEEQKQRYLPGMCSGSLVAANAMSEPGTGSDAFAMATRAVREMKGYRITGRKTFCSNGPIADLAVVYAVTDPNRGRFGGISVFLVERGTPGFSVGQRFEKMGLRTSPIGELVFDDAIVPGEAMIGEPGAGGILFTESMEWERVCIAAVHVGTMQRLVERCVAYARTRKAFGKPIGKFQAVSHRIADMQVRLETSRWLVYRAASRLGRVKEMALDASTAKLHVSESLVQSALDAVQVMGGYGFMQEYQVERVLRDAVGSTLYSGTSDIQKNIIAGWLGL